MKVKDLLTDPSKWTQCKMARDAKGIALVDQELEYGVSFCLLGAVRRCYIRGTKEYNDILRRICNKIKLDYSVPEWGMDLVSGPITCWNDKDGRTFEEVRALVDELDI